MTVWNTSFLVLIVTPNLVGIQMTFRVIISSFDRQGYYGSVPIYCIWPFCPLFSLYFIEDIPSPLYIIEDILSSWYLVEDILSSLCLIEDILSSLYLIEGRHPLFWLRDGTLYSVWGTAPFILRDGTLYIDWGTAPFYFEGRHPLFLIEGRHPLFDWGTAPFVWLRDGTLYFFLS